MAENHIGMKIGVSADTSSAEAAIDSLADNLHKKRGQQIDDTIEASKAREKEAEAAKKTLGSMKSAVESLRAWQKKLFESGKLTFDEYGNIIVKETGKIVSGLAEKQVKAGVYLDKATRKAHNSLGQLVEGLSTASQVAGDWIDSQGRVRDETGKVIAAQVEYVQALTALDRSLGLHIDDNGRLVKELEVEGKTIVRYYDELSAQQKRVGMYADEQGRIFNKNDKFVHKYTQSTTEALRDARDFQLQLIESQSSIAGFLETSEHNWVRYFAIYQKIAATIAHDLLASGGSTATIKTLWEGMKDNLKDTVATFKKFAESWEQNKTVADAMGGGALTKVKGVKNELAAAADAAIRFASPFLSVGAVALPEIIRGFKWIGSKIDEMNEAPFKGLSDGLRNVAETARLSYTELEKLNGATISVGEGVGTVLSSSFHSELQRLRKEYEDSKNVLASAIYARDVRMEDDYSTGFNSMADGSDYTTINYFRKYGLQSAVDKAAEARNAALTSYVEASGRQIDALIDSFKSESEKLIDQQKDYVMMRNDLWEYYQVVVKGQGRWDKEKETLRKLSGLNSAIDEQAEKIKEAQEKEKAGADTSARAANAKAEMLRAAGIDSFLKAQDDATLSYENLAETLVKWETLSKNGSLNQEELNQATAKARDAVRQNLESELGVKWGEEASGIATQLAKLKTAVENQAITAEEQARATQQLYAKERDALAQKLGLELDARDELTKTYKEAAERVKEAFKKGEISKEDGRELLAAAKRRRLDSLRALAGETGVSLDAQGVPTAQAEKKKVELEAAREYLASVEKWKKALESSEVGQSAYDAAIEQLKARALAQAQEGWNGKDAEKQLAELQELRDAEIITAKKFDDAKKELTAQIEAAAKKQRLDNLRSELGVDSIMESLKTPAARLKETMDKLAEAQKAGVISEKELAAVRSKAYQEYLDATQERGVEETLTKIKPESKSKEKSDKTTAGESLSQGSESLYKAMLKRRAPTAYETKMQSAADRMCAYQYAGNQIAMEQSDYLGLIANGFQALGNLRVFG